MFGIKGDIVERFVSGNTKTTAIGYVNVNDQLCTGHRGKQGNDHRQLAYRVLCLRSDCGHLYGANGTDIFQRLCPNCQSGAPSIQF